MKPNNPNEPKILRPANDNGSPKTNGLEHIFLPIFNIAFAAAISSRPELLTLTQKLQELTHMLMAGKYNDKLTERPITSGNLTENITVYLKEMLDNYFKALLSTDQEKIEAEIKLFQVEIDSIKKLES